ncbi:hypothetical protein EVAR_52776_1 [Eumeta japonica]|uniref:Uncharacterized protein n=1 Tax=Eumeta variegata TaxID=151549 RepID=A0A4C1XGF4_EUMVA|nr:hypothetical protein EVAR_52776_1 [Eumeta japonica]
MHMRNVSIYQLLADNSVDGMAMAKSVLALRQLNPRWSLVSIRKCISVVHTTVTQLKYHSYLSKGKRASEALESRRSPPPMDTHSEESPVHRRPLGME